MEATCDSIHITWNAPTNVGEWSPVTDYAVFIESTELVPFEDSLPTATDDASIRTLPHKVAYRQKSLELTGLVASTEYTAMVLPRNVKGWGSRWSAPLRATTGPPVLPPQKAAAPAVRPAEGCKAAYVRVPTASTGCRAADEFLLQVHLLTDTERGWTTLQHAEPGSIAEMTGFGPGTSFAVRLVAQNAHGAALPSESTAITPGPFGGCNSERTWTGSQSLTSEKDDPPPTGAGGSPVNIIRWAASAVAVVLASACALRVCQARRSGYGKLSMMSPGSHELEDGGGEGLLGNGMRAWDGDDDPEPRSDSAATKMESVGGALGGLFSEQSELEPFGEPTREAAHGNRVQHHEDGSDYLEMLDAAGEAALLARVSELLSPTFEGSEAAMACCDRKDLPPKGGRVGQAQPYLEASASDSYAI